MINQYFILQWPETLKWTIWSWNGHHSHFQWASKRWTGRIKYRNPGWRLNRLLICLTTCKSAIYRHFPAHMDWKLDLFISLFFIIIIISLILLHSGCTTSWAIFLLYFFNLFPPPPPPILIYFSTQQFFMSLCVFILNSFSPFYFIKMFCQYKMLDLFDFARFVVNRFAQNPSRACALFPQP